MNTEKESQANSDIQMQDVNESQNKRKIETLDSSQSLEEKKEKEEEEDEEIEDDDVYEVEKIVKHRKTTNGVMQYFIKWKGYPSNENTWEDADNIQADDLLEQYWRQYNNKHGKSTSRGTKRQRSDTKASTRSTTTRTMKSNESSTESTTKTIKTEQPMESIKTESTTEPIKTEQTMEEVTDDQWPPQHLTSWENEVLEVETVERNPSGVIYVYLRWKNGQYTCHPSPEVHQKCPLHLLRFYEDHLRFR